jgi:O-antigen/teichoic acid export membrane protein
VNGLVALWRRIRASGRAGIVRGVGVIAGGTAIAQGLTILASPLITRLYGPEAVGVVGVFTATVAVISPVSALGYNLAVALPREDNDAKTIVRLSLRIGAIVSVVLLSVVAFSHRPFAAATNFTESSLYFLLLPAVILLSSVELTYTQWLIRKHRFPRVSGISIVQSGATNGTKVALGYFIGSPAVLILATVGGNGLRALLYWLSSRRETSSGKELPEDRRSAAKRLAREYRDYPSQRAPQMMLNSVSRNLPTVLIAAFFGPAVAGFYSIGQRVMQLPSALVAQSVGKVLLPHLAETAHSGGNLPSKILLSTAALAAVGLIPFGLVAAFGPTLFAFVFGPEWVEAGQYARWMALWLFCSFLSVPTIQSLGISRSQGFMLLWEAIATPVRLFAIVVAAVFVGEAHVAVVFYSAATVVAYAVLMFGGIRRASKGTRFD